MALLVLLKRLRGAHLAGCHASPKRKSALAAGCHSSEPALRPHAHSHLSPVHRRLLACVRPTRPRLASARIRYRVSRPNQGNFGFTISARKSRAPVCRASVFDSAFTRICSGRIQEAANCESGSNELLAGYRRGSAASAVTILLRVHHAFHRIQ